MKILTTLLLVLTFALPATAEVAEDPVANMITAFTKNIDKFAKWPGEKAIKSGGKPLFVAVVGTSDMAKGLKTLNRTETSAGHKLTVRVVDLDLLPANAQVVIICLDDTTQARKITKKLAATGTFTIAFGPEKVGALLHCQMDPTKPGKVVAEVSQSVADAEEIEIQPAMTVLAKVVK
jgi:hypothetical protein